MNRLSKMHAVCLLIGAATIVGSGNAEVQGARPGTNDVTAVPKVSGPVPVTSDSFPFLAADRNLEPTDLKKYGYVEEEFIVTGTANVYDWAADGALTVKTPGVPYGTRILVRRPGDPGRFSGDVIVEPLNAVRRFDWPWIWGYSHESFLQHGDAWVGITLCPSPIRRPLPVHRREMPPYRRTRTGCGGTPSARSARCSRATCRRGRWQGCV
jgi:hypothetical protein